MIDKIEFVSIRESLCEAVFVSLTEEKNSSEEIIDIYKRLSKYFDNEEFCACFIIDEFLTALKINFKEEYVIKIKQIINCHEFLVKYIDFNSLLLDLKNTLFEPDKAIKEKIELNKELLLKEYNSKIIYFYLIKKYLSILTLSGYYMNSDYMESYSFYRKEYNKFCRDNDFIKQIELLNYFKF